jgi:pyruvate kinase
MKLPAKKTKIVCTIGPASNEPERLEQMISQGMNIARINFAHGDVDGHKQNVANIRAAAQKLGERVAIMGDLPGPKIRIGELAEEPVELHRGQSFVLHSDPVAGDDRKASIDFPGLTQAVKPGDHIYMNDGYIQLAVEEVVGREVHCTVLVGGELRSHKGVNFPGVDLGISAFTEQDRRWLAVAAGLGLDAVSQSFVQRAEDIRAVREAAADLGYEPAIVAKIERAGALDHIQEILEVTDGVMVARGDLGVEIPIEEIPAAQKQLIEQANLAGKPVITATQMLESMTTNRRPTRAEVTDVANAILDGTDAVMLSGETAIGSYPVETVVVMARIAQRTEETYRGQFGIGRLLETRGEKNGASQADLISASVFGLAKTLNPTIVFVPSLSGGTARRLARFRLAQWIVAPSRDQATCQKLQFTYGVYPVYVPAEEVLATPEERSSFTREWLRNFGVEGDIVLLVEGSGTLKAEDTRRIDIIER